MDSDEKLMGLKKAYADVIMNTAKEAAARIMVCERKSATFENELNANKEQAIQMLVRLKQMMDSKISEAEKNSLSQQKKIKELEAQLQEAENIAKELREELKEVHGELDRVKNKHLKEKEAEIQSRLKEKEAEINSHLREKEAEINSHLKVKKAEITSSATVYMEKSALNQISEVYNTYQDDIDGSDNIVEPNTDPIPEDKLNAVELQGEANTGRPELSSFPIVNTYISKPSLPSIIRKSKGSEPYRNRRTQRIRAFEEKLMAGELTFSNTIDKVKDDTNAKSGDDEGVYRKTGPKFNGTKGVRPAVPKVKSLKRKRGTFTKNKKNTIQLSGHSSDQALGIHQTSDISCGELNSENHDVEWDHIPLAMFPRLSKSKQADDCTVEQDENPLDMLSRLSETLQDEDWTLVKCTKGSKSDMLSETVALQSGSAVADKDDVAVVSSKEVIAGTDCDLSRQLISDKVFKYTYQRRKKKCLSNSNSNASVETKIMKEKEVAVEKQKDLAEADNSISVDESSKDSRRMAQVARQLISMSGKKGWK